jgi:hypothetical protein
MASLALALAACLAGTPLTAQLQQDPSPHSDAQLVAELAAIRPGEAFTVALRLTMDAGWRSYWRNPGDAGGETVIEWTLPEGFAAGEIQWPHPRRIEAPPLASYGYDDEVLLLVEILPAIVSSAPGKQGYHEPAEMNAISQDKGSAADAVLLDPEGDVGQLYGAKTTPQMILIDPEGTLLYNGAIDDRPTARLADVEGAHNYLVAAIGEATAGDAVSVATTQPYGCSVKYKN